MWAFYGYIAKVVAAKSGDIPSTSALVPAVHDRLRALLISASKKIKIIKKVWN